VQLRFGYDTLRSLKSREHYDHALDDPGKRPRRKIISVDTVAGIEHDLIERLTKNKPRYESEK
jgi:hypothetical protein